MTFVIVVQFVEFRLGIVFRIVHEHHDEHAVADSFTDRVFRLVKLDPGLISLFFIVSLEPDIVDCLDMFGAYTCGHDTVLVFGLLREGKYGSRESG